jgi:hypothetical protein
VRSLIDELLSRMHRCWWAIVAAVRGRLDYVRWLRWRMRESQVGRSAVGFIAIALLLGGAALGFLVANATAREDVRDLNPARASNLAAVDTVRQTITTVRVIAAKRAVGHTQGAFTITERSSSLPARTVGYTQTITDVGTRTRTRTITTTRTVTVTELQQVTVTVEGTKTKPPK